MKDNKIGEDIAVIKEKISALTKSFEDFRNDNKGLISRVDEIESCSIKTGERVSNLSVFQTVFSIVIGAIASYLGYKK